MINTTETEREIINIKDIRGLVFKKEFNLDRCRFGYHNKNTNGGNFGLDFYFESEFNSKTDFRLHGDYKKNGELYSLSVMSIRMGGFMFKLIVEDLDSLKTQLQAIIKQLKNDSIIEGLEK